MDVAQARDRVPASRPCGKLRFGVGGRNRRRCLSRRTKSCGWKPCWRRRARSRACARCRLWVLLYRPRAQWARSERQWRAMHLRDPFVAYICTAACQYCTSATALRSEHNAFHYFAGRPLSVARTGKWQCVGAAFAWTGCGCIVGGHPAAVSGKTKERVVAHASRLRETRRDASWRRVCSVRRSSPAGSSPRMRVYITRREGTRGQ